MNVQKTTRDWERQPEFFREMSKEYHMAVVCGYPSAPVRSKAIQAGDADSDQAGCTEPVGAGDVSSCLCRNHLAIYNDGDLLMDYAKIHPFTYGVESDYFEGGDQVCTAGFRDTILGGFVCYDLRFPEIFQCSSDESEIIFVIANWPRARVAHWDILLQARAIENQCYIIGVNRTGTGGGLDYPGHSAVYSPEGQVCTPLSEDETLILADLDPAHVRTYRQNFPTKKDRRRELYGKLKVSS